MRVGVATGVRTQGTQEMQKRRRLRLDATPAHLTHNLFLLMKVTTRGEHSEFLAIPAFKARFCRSYTADSNSVKGTMFSSLPAFQRYKVRPYAMDIHGVRFCYETGIYTARLDSTPDSSIPRCPIPVLSTGRCSATS